MRAWFDQAFADVSQFVGNVITGALVLVVGFFAIILVLAILRGAIIGLHHLLTRHKQARTTYPPSVHNVSRPSSTPCGCGEAYHWAGEEFPHYLQFYPVRYGYVGPLFDRTKAKRWSGWTVCSRCHTSWMSHTFQGLDSQGGDSNIRYIDYITPIKEPVESRVYAHGDRTLMESSVGAGYPLTRTGWDELAKTMRGTWCLEPAVATCPTPIAVFENRNNDMGLKAEVYRRITIIHHFAGHNCPSEWVDQMVLVMLTEHFFSGVSGVDRDVINWMLHREVKALSMLLAENETIPAHWANTTGLVYPGTTEQIPLPSVWQPTASTKEEAEVYRMAREYMNAEPIDLPPAPEPDPEPRRRRIEI